jgi:hypothetical protein
MYKINIKELEEYLITEKIYKPTAEVDNLFIAHKTVGDVQQQINDIANKESILNNKIEQMNKEHAEMKQYIKELEGRLLKENKSSEGLNMIAKLDNHFEKPPTKKINKMPQLVSKKSSSRLKHKTTGSTKDLSDNEIDDFQFDV